MGPGKRYKGKLGHVFSDFPHGIILFLMHQQMWISMRGGVEFERDVRGWL
jgi:hypothetical protein